MPSSSCVLPWSEASQAPSEADIGARRVRFGREVVGRDIAPGAGKAKGAGGPASSTSTRTMSGTASMPTTSTKMSGTTARHASGEILLLFRCVREAREHSEAEVDFQRNAAVLVDELPSLVKRINDKTLKTKVRGAAVARVSHALAYVAESHEMILLAEFPQSKTNVLRSIVNLCLDVSVSRAT